MKGTGLIAIAFTVLCSCTNAGTDIRKVAETVADKGSGYVDYGQYAGTVYTQALATFAVTARASGYLDMAKDIAADFVSGERKGGGSFISYDTGGTLLPFLAWNGYEEAAATAGETAKRMWEGQLRNKDDVMIANWDGLYEKNALFADCVLAVTPYFLYDGLVEGNSEYLDYSAFMAVRTYEDLRDAESGLIHQARAVNWLEEGEMTEDCWSRANGWLSLGMGALMKDLPKDNPNYVKVAECASEFYSACLGYQDEEGLWHQEMTWPDSYPEISGSALILYGIGCGIRAGVLDRRTFLPAFKKGLEGMLKYIDEDCNICNTCSGCLTYGDGSKAAYASHPYWTNEVHAFGPVLLALTAALELGIRKVDARMGENTVGRIPLCHVRHIAERKGDIAWENDMLAFRIYSREVMHKVSSGVDFWTKCVDYPVLEHWYELDGNGGSYHTDSGEGYDFYAVGRNRGIGGIGIWTGSELAVPEPYLSYDIVEDGPERLEFNLHYPDIAVGGDSISLSENISMVLGTRFYRAVIHADSNLGREMTVAVGLTDFGNAEAEYDAGKGTLSIIETISEDDGAVAGAIVPCPGDFAGFASYGQDRLVLLRTAGNPITVYVGAAWSKDQRMEHMNSRWPALVEANGWNELNAIYER